MLSQTLISVTNVLAIVTVFAAGAACGILALAILLVRLLH